MGSLGGGKTKKEYNAERVETQCHLKHMMFPTLNLITSEPSLWKSPLQGKTPRRQCEKWHLMENLKRNH